MIEFKCLRQLLNSVELANYSFTLAYLLVVDLLLFLTISFSIATQVAPVASFHHCSRHFSSSSPYLGSVH